MYAQLKRFKIKSDQREAALRVRVDVDALIRDVPGLKQHLTLFDEDGTGLVIAIRDDEEPSAEAKTKIAAIWARFADVMETAPERETFRVFRNLTID